ncbi:MAG: OsmC family peroxiredoxin [Bacteroidetes bacterium]|nr:OsmC family peroxiredoxin [Bacteroidota bacterium]
MKRSSTATWQGSGKQGSGKLSTESKLIENADFAYNTRFENSKGTNPEELIAAAHASCFSMKFSFVLAEDHYTADVIETTCTITLSEGKITKSHLNVKAKVPGISKEDFIIASEKTLNECPVSKALNVEITMEAILTDELELDPTNKS